MSTAPRWEDSGQGDLLELVAMGSSSTGSADEEWEWFENSLRIAARTHGTPWGTIDPNVLREQVRHVVAPRRIGAFTNRALSQNLVEYTGNWVVSDDAEGRNRGKPCRELRWIGGAL